MHDEGLSVRLSEKARSYADHRRRRRREKKILASVDRAAGSLGIATTAVTYRLLRRLALEIDGAGRQVVVIADGRGALRLTRAIAQIWPTAEVRIITANADQHGTLGTIRRTPARGLEDVFQAVAAGPAPDVIIESARHRRYRRFGAFRRLFLSLNDGGVYVAHGVDVESAAAIEQGADESTSRWLERLSSELPAEATAWERAAAEALGDVTRKGHTLFVRKHGEHLMKIHNLLHRPEGEARIEDAIVRRCGAGSVERICEVPAETFEVRSDFQTTDPAWAAKYLRQTYAVRELVAREYRGAVIAPRQVVTMGGLLLPESSMQPLVRPTISRITKDAGEDYAVAPFRGDAVPTLEGVFFHLDNEFPGHYGHFTSQDLSKLWAWDAVLAAEPDIRVLISPPHRADDLHEFQYRLLEAFGIPRERVVVFKAPVRVERLVNATFGFQNMYFASPLCTDVWQRIRKNIASESTATLPTRVFISRGGQYHRRCLNSEEIEQVFVDAGFEVVHPEKLAIEDQIAMFSQAEAVAGYSGSGMFGMAYSSGATTWMVIGSRGYTATTEYQFASLYGDPIRYVICDPEVEQPAVGWSREAYFSDYRFNFERDGARLQEMLDAL